MINIYLIVVTLAILLAVMLMGMLITYFVEQDQNSIALNFISGILIFFTLFQILALITIFLHTEFTTLKIVYSITVGIFLVISFCLNLKRIVLLCKHKKPNKIENEERRMIIPLVIIILIFMLSNVFWEIGVWGDDTYYVGTATTAIETNSMFQYSPYTGRPYAAFPWRYVLSPYPIFHAYLSNLFGVHPTIMIRMIIPIISKVFLICVFYSIGKMLFNCDKGKVYSFLFYALLVIVFSGTGLGSPGFFAILYLHMGKALLYATFMPLCFYIYSRLFTEESNKAEWVLLICLIIGSSLVSSMSVILITMCIGILGIVHLIKTKNIKEVSFMAICCIPNIILGVLFALNTSTMDIYIPM